MTQPQNAEHNPNQGSIEAQATQDVALSAGESSVQAMRLKIIIGRFVKSARPNRRSQQSKRLVSYYFCSIVM